MSKGVFMMVLHGSAGSPYVTRVLMQAAAKNLDLELRPANMADPEFRRMDPIGKMPVLEHEGFVLPESYVICEYLEDVSPTPRSAASRRRTEPASV
jgi:glutathione S-transferase